MASTTHLIEYLPSAIRTSCDRCSAAAVVRTLLLGGGSLSWCGHHFGSNEDALRAAGALIIEDTRLR
jgi:hypothetical protein